MQSEGSRRDVKGLLRKWARYALGIMIECAAVVVISLSALLILLIIKVIMT
jgi:preprotein translocase subunit Sec61beta